MEVAPTDLDAATIMDLETNPAPSLADRLIGDVGHRLTVEPGLEMVAFQADAHSVPLSVFKDVLFLVRNLIQPAAAVGLVDSTGVMVWRSDLDLPSADLHALRDDGTDEHSRVAVSELLEFKGEIEVVVILKKRLTNNKLHFILFLCPVFPVLVLAGPSTLGSYDVTAHELTVWSGEVIFSE